MITDNENILKYFNKEANVNVYDKITLKLQSGDGASFNCI